MFSIFSTQNLQTFLRRKTLRPPSRGGPRGPERLPNRGPERGPSWRGPSDRGVALGADPSSGGAGAFVSSVILAPSFLAGVHLSGAATSRIVVFCTQTAGVYRSGRGRSFTRRGRSLHRRRGAHFLARLAELLDLVQTLLFLVNPHGEELDDGLGHAQAALQLVDHSPPAFDRQQNVNAIVKASHGVCQPTFAHALYALDGATSSRYRRLQRGNQFVQIVVQHVGPNDEHQFISTIHSLSPNSPADVSRIIPDKSRKSPMSGSPGSIRG